MIDKEETCVVCGYVSHLGVVAQHHLIPESVTKEAGIPESVTMSLCSNCHYELHAWCRMKVTSMTYDPDTKRFRDKPWEEKVKDYESAFVSFKKYKDEQRKISRRK